MAEDEQAVDEAFQFTEADLMPGPLKPTTWRERLSPIFKKILEDRYRKDFAVWQAIAGRARILIAEKKEKHPAYSHSMLYFDQDRGGKDEDHEDFSYGLWVLKGVVAGCDYAKKYPYCIMDNDWSWARMLSRLEEDKQQQLFRSIVEKNSFNIRIRIWHANDHVKLFFSLIPDGSGLTRRNVKKVTSSAISWEQFFEELKLFPADESAEILVYRDLKVGKDRSIHLGSAVDAFSALMPLYKLGYSSVWDYLDEDLFLINAVGPDDDISTHRSFLNLHDKVAMWFSYPMRDSFIPLLEGKTFPLLLYSKGKLTHALRVVAYETSKGMEGIVSPYEEATLKQERKKKKMGSSQAQICKTWCLIDRIVDIEPPIPIEYFEDYEKGTPLFPGAMQNSFAYAKKAGESMADIYQYFQKKGLYFAEEIITNYYLSLKTKPFVIISGISGTGKTKIAQCFAEYMCPPEEVEVTELPENTENEFHIKVNKMLLSLGRLYINQILADYFEIPEKGHRIDLTFDFNGQSEQGRINNIGYTDPGKSQTVFVSLRQGAKKWAKENFKLGDVLKFTILDDDRTHYRIEKGASGVKRSLESNRLAFISVRPDWMDNRGLLGFYNLLTGAYQPSELLKIMLRAQDDPDRPYFVILDEMNLAKVEYYFSDFLSCLESRMDAKDGKVNQEPIYLHDQEEDLEYVDGSGVTYYIPPSIRIPTNLYFTGTVNVDETTYMFSPKVLDRANTIEFNEVDLVGYGAGEALVKPGGFKLLKGMDARAQFPGLQLARAEDYRSLDAEKREYLEQINAVLVEYHLHFGYRVANEIALYVQNATELTGQANTIKAFDLQILQKILPKFHGSRQKLEEPLLRLFAFCFGEAPTEGNYRAFLESHIEDIGNAKFSRSARKIERMLKVLGDQGFASFIE